MITDKAKALQQARIGGVFGHLTVLALIQNGKVYACRCDCGGYISAKVGRLNSVRRGHQPSCGCAIRGSNNVNWTGVGEIYGGFWTRLTSNASRRNILIQITATDLWQQFQAQKGKCALSGILLELPTSRGLQRGHRSSASVDRIDSCKGYIPGNIQWVHKTINMMKQSLSVAEFKQWCRLVSLQ